MPHPLIKVQDHPLATPQYTRMDLRNEDGSFILFWLPSTIEHLDKVANEVEVMKAQRLGRTGRD